MHEMSIATNLMQNVLSYVPDGQKLNNIYITLGPFSGISLDSLVFCFSIIAGEYGNSHAKLIVNSIPASFKCHECEKKYETDDPYSGCPVCKSMNRIILSGDQFTLDAIDVEEKDNV